MKFVSCAGSRIHKHYEPHFDGSRVCLVESGHTDIQAEIESYAKYTDLHYMLHRLSVGDSSVLCSKTPIYGDFSGLPSNPVDVINLVHRSESMFSELSPEERAKFNNDYRSWLVHCLSSFSSGENPVPGNSPDIVKPDVIKPEIEVT
jgi:hypothetical protein